MKITDFLLARVADDEAVASAAAGGCTDDEWSETPWEAREGWDFTWGDTGTVEMLPARVLAECAAKRVAVSVYVLADAALYGTFAPAAYARLEDARRVVSALAVVYADHRDFDEAWRV